MENEEVNNEDNEDTIEEGSEEKYIVPVQNNKMQIICDTGRFTADVSKQILGFILNKKSELNKIKNEIKMAEVMGAEHRKELYAQSEVTLKKLSTKYNIYKSSIDATNKEIDNLYLELKRFDVNTMTDNQRALYEGILKSAVGLRMESLRIYELIFGA